MSTFRREFRLGSYAARELPMRPVMVLYYHPSMHQDFIISPHNLPLHLTFLASRNHSARDP